MKIAKKYTLISLVFLAALLIPLNAQIPNSMYFMPGVPQSNRINPSIQPACGFYLGFPGLAPVRLQVSSSSLAFNDIIYYNSDIDSLITPLHPLGDKEAFLENLKDVNYFLSSLGISLTSFGFRANKSYFSFDITARLDGNIYYPKGIFELVFNGLENEGNISFGGLGIDMNAFTEFAMGWSKKDFFIPNLDIGVRGKMLFGIANISTKSSVFDLSTSSQTWNLNTEMQINAASAAPEIVIFSDSFEDGPVSIDDDYLASAAPMEIVKQVFNMDQFGLAMDVGASYRPFPELLLSASVMDFGGINWKNTLEGGLDFEYEFTGIHLDPFSDTENSLLPDLQDSIINSVYLEAGVPYYSRLNTKVFAGASYYPLEKIGFGLLSRTDFLNQKISQQFTGSVNITTGKFANLSLSYSYISQKFNNIGAGVSINLGPSNIYVISDNIISGALNPRATRSVNLWFGMNFTFGWKKAKKAEKAEKTEKMEKQKEYDLPLIY